MTGPAQEAPPQPATVFVGRERELASLRAALAAAVGGHGRVVLVSGEPGIGKTQLAEEFARHSDAEGATVRWGHCWEGEGAPAFWPWIQILRVQFAETDAAELRAQLGAGVEDIAQLMPELHERLPDVPPPPSLEGADTRFRLFDSVARFLGAAAAGRPLALILEDVHWADAASLGLLRFLTGAMQECRLLILATYRDVGVSAPHPLGELLGALAYHPLVERVEMQGLSEDEIGALIESLGHERSASVVARVCRESGGNPFFATEIVRALGAGMSASIPGTVRDAVGDRLRRLSEACRRLLDIAAVIGQEFRLGLLERVLTDLGVTAGTAVLQLLSEATNARIVGEVTGAVSEYRFTHALIREVLYTELPLADRLRLHWHVATGLEAVGGPSREQSVSALAHHFSEAIAGCAEEPARRACVDKAALYAAKAAEQATAMLAYEEAAVHYEQALRTLEAWAPRDTRRQCEMLLALGDAQRCAAAKYAVRNETFQRAAAMARQRGEPELLARAALGLAAGTSVFEATSAAHAALLQEALGAVGPQDSTLRARLLAALAGAKYFPDPHVYSEPLSAEAVAVARRVGDPGTVVSALSSRFWALTEPGQTAERMALAAEILDLSERSGFRERVLWARIYRFIEAMELGDVAAMERDLPVYAKLADELRQPFFRSRTLGMRAALALLGGRFAEAEQLALGALQLMQPAEDPLVLQECVAQLSVVYWEQGRYGDLDGFVRAALEQRPFIPGDRAVLANFCAEAGRTDEARAEIERLSRDNFAVVPRDHNWRLYTALLTNACALVGEAKHAATLYALLLPYAPYLVVTRVGPLCLGSISLRLGLLADTLGRWDDALHHLDEALAVHERIASPPWIANTQYAMAAALLARDGAGDRERARALLAEVLQTTERLGMLRLQRKALALQEQMAGESSPFEEGGSRGIGSDGSSEKFPRAPLFQRGETLNATFRKEADYWIVGYTVPTFRLKDRLGFRYLAVLLRNPGREFLAVDLVATVQGGSGGSVPNHRPESTGGGPEPHLDEQARREYAQRLRDLHVVVEEAQAFHDPERASRAQAEIDVLTDELRRGMGLGRRARPSGSPAERARVSVRHAIRAAMQAIAEHDPALGQYLVATIKTGTFCSYSPDPRVAVAWEL